MSNMETVKEPFDPMTAKILVTSFYITTMGLLYLLFMRIKWVGMTTTHLYVSNFFKSYKYTYDSIDKFEETNMLLFTRVILRFHDKTKFGKTIFFIRSHYLKYFLEKHPTVLAELLNTDPTTVEVTENQA